jgi:ABC-type sugar transport system ATPase subunit
VSERADAVRMRGIAKRFGSVQALRGADFSCAPGERAA